MSACPQFRGPLMRILAVHSCKHGGCVQGRLVVDGLRGGAVAGGAVSRPKDMARKDERDVRVSETRLVVLTSSVQRLNSTVKKIIIIIMQFNTV